MSVRKWVELEIEGTIGKEDGTEVTNDELIEIFEANGLYFGGFTKPVTFVDDDDVIYEESEWLAERNETRQKSLLNKFKTSLDRKRKV